MTKETFQHRLKQTFKRLLNLLKKSGRSVAKNHSIEHHKKPSSHSHKGEVHSKKKKLGFRRKLLLSFNVIALLVLIYFVVLTSISPTSFPFVTQKVQSKLQSLVPGSSIQNSFISFTTSGRLKISVIGLKFPYAVPESLEQKIFTLPQLEAEFSLLRLVMMNFYPSRVKAIGANLVLDDLRNLQKKEENQMGHELMIMQVLSAIKTIQLPINVLDLENISLVVKDDKVETKILVKRSSIKASVGKSHMRLISDSRISFNDDKEDVLLNADCNFSDFSGLKCKTKIENLETDSIALLNPALSKMSQVHAVVRVSADFEIEKSEFKNVTFKVSADDGEFEFPDFFAQKMHIRNFLLEGEYDNKLNVVNLSKVRTEFKNEAAEIKGANDESSQIKKVKNANQAFPVLEMSLLISDVRNAKFVTESESGFGASSVLPNHSISGVDKRFDFYISLQNVLTDDLEKFWPVALSGNDIRQWVVTHIEGGTIKGAYARFSMLKSGDDFYLAAIDSQLAFSGLNLNYDAAFPSISDLSGVAHFDEKSMNIAIVDGKVLSSKIYEGQVAIDDFFAHKVVLKIAGKSEGQAVDGLLHVDHGAKFSAAASKYLNGNALNSFVVTIPLGHETKLYDSYINVSSAITGLSNVYAKGDVKINLEKKVDSNNFATAVNLTAARVEAKGFNLKKDLGIESTLNFDLVIEDQKHLSLKNILLLKKKEIVEEEKNTKHSKAAQNKDADANDKKFLTAKVFGDISFEVSPFLLRKVNLTNKNFGDLGKDDYKLSYSFAKDKSLQTLAISGSRIDLEECLKQKSFSLQPEDGNSHLVFSAKFGRVDLLRNKFVKNFSFSLSCANGFCYNVAARANYGVGQFLTLRSDKKPKENFTTLNGNFSDVGYLAEALGISNVVGGGYVRATLKNSMNNNKNLFAGEVYVKDQITIYDNAAVKKLASNSLFSKVKDKIFSSEKVVLTTAKVDIELYDSQLNIKSLIANNYKIGFTAKGVINLRDDSCDISGKIVPGFIINNLFGIGKIPLLGGIVRGVLTGGEEGGGLFGIRYSYVKNRGDKEAKFDTSTLSSFVPTTIGNLFE